MNTEQEISADMFLKTATREFTAALNFGALIGLLKECPDVSFAIKLGREFVGQLTEELWHFELAMSGFAELIGEQIAWQRVRARLGGNPVLLTPTSLLQGIVGVYLEGMVAHQQLDSCLESSCGPYRNMAEQICAAEKGHQTFGLSVIQKLQPSPDELQEAVGEQMPIMLKCFGRLNSENDRLAVKYGLKSRGAVENSKAFIAQINEDLSIFGISVTV